MKALADRGLEGDNLVAFQTYEAEAYEVEKRLRNAPAPASAPKIVGYRRVFDGGCADCRRAATLIYSREALMPIHEHCNCGIAPVFEGEDHGLTPALDSDYGSPDGELGARMDQPLQKKSGKPSGSKTPPAWKSLEGDDLADYLHAHKTIGDKMWSDLADGAVRAKGESRGEFIDRVLRGKAAPKAEAKVEAIAAPPPVKSAPASGWKPLPRTDVDLRPDADLIYEAEHEIQEAERILNLVGVPEGTPAMKVVPGDISGFHQTFTMVNGEGVKDSFISLREGWTADELIHEMGHVIDDLVLKGRKGYKAERKEVIALGRDTKSYKQLKGEHVKHDRDPDEIWARAYEQWAVTRADEQRLRAIQASYERYWTDEEFAPIARKMDEIFGYEAPATAARSEPIGKLASEAEVQADFQAWEDALDVDQTATLIDYGGNGAVELNESLRLAEHDPEMEQWAEELDQIMRPIGVDTKVFRGLKGSWEDLFGAPPEVGGTITDAGFMSTTHNEALAKKFGAGSKAGVRVDITVPKGTPSAWLSDAGHGSELVLGRGRTLRITKVHSDNHIEVEVVENAADVSRSGADAIDWNMGQDEAEARLNAQFADIDETTSSEQMDAVMDYIGSPTTNILLRGSSDPRFQHIDMSAIDIPSVEKTIARIDETMRPLEEDVVVHRGIMTSFEKTFGAKPEVGGVIEDKGFVSTSTDTEISEQFGGDDMSGVHVEMLVPKGSPALWVGQLAPESELLLARSARFEIVDVLSEHHIRVRVIENGPAADIASNVKAIKKRKKAKWDRRQVPFGSQEYDDLLAQGYQLKGLNAKYAELQKEIV